MSATKSAGVVGKWGSASFTSLRASKPVGVSGSSPGVAKPKKFFKSRSANKDKEQEDEGKVYLLLQCCGRVSIIHNYWTRSQTNFLEKDERIGQFAKCDIALSPYCFTSS